MTPVALTVEKSTTSGCAAARRRSTSLAAAVSSPVPASFLAAAARSPSSRSSAAWIFVQAALSSAGSPLAPRSPCVMETSSPVSMPYVSAKLPLFTESCSGKGDSNSSSGFSSGTSP